MIPIWKVLNCCPSLVLQSIKARNKLSLHLNTAYYNKDHALTKVKTYSSHVSLVIPR